MALTTIRLVQSTPDLKPEKRQSSDNGIWLCQTHAKLVDSDDSRHTVASLKGWKSISEAMARGELEQRDFTVDRMQKFVKAEQLMPALLMEMRNDLATNPLTREFVVLKRAGAYNSGGEDFTAYLYDEHPQLDGMLQVLQNLGLIRDVTRTNVKRFRFTEELVDYLTATNPGPPRMMAYSAALTLVEPWRSVAGSNDSTWWRLLDLRHRRGSGR